MIPQLLSGEVDSDVWPRHLAVHQAKLGLLIELQLRGTGPSVAVVAQQTQEVQEQVDNVLQAHVHPCQN